MKIAFFLLLLTAVFPGLAQASDSPLPAGDQETPSTCDAKGLIYHGMGKCVDIQIKTIVVDGGQSIKIEVRE